MLNKFTIKKEWYDLIKSRDDQERLDAYDAIFSMAFDTGIVNVPSTGIINFLHGAVFKEVARQQGVVQKRRIAGSMGGAQKVANAAAPTDKRSRPSAKTSKPTSSEFREDEAMFGVFWERYDLKRDKDGALRAWRRLHLYEREAAINGIEAYKARCKIEGVARVYPQGYLSHRRWLDDPTPVKGGSPSGLNSSTKNNQDGKDEKDKRRGMEVTAKEPSDFQSTF